jgi:hypothetical protein
MQNGIQHSNDKGNEINEAAQSVSLLVLVQSEAAEETRFPKFQVFLQFHVCS